MDDPAEQLIRRALGRRPPPTLGPRFADDVLARVHAAGRHADSVAATGRRWTAVATWLLAGTASLAVLSHVGWPALSGALGWGLALAMVPLSYSVALWPGRFVCLLALCCGFLPGVDASRGRAGRGDADGGG
jgi:hypothetical protein